MVKIKQEVQEGSRSDFRVREDGIVMFGKRICLPPDEGLKRGI